MSDDFKILSIDGGGFRGAYAAHILKRIEEEFKINWKDDFGLIAGTSTGSIIAAGLACGMSAAKISEFYQNHGQDIFQKRPFCWKGIFASKYSSEKLGEVLEEIFEGKKLGEVNIPLIIPSTDIGNGRVHVFKSQYNDEFYRDKDVRVSDAVLASCSAPTYFDPHNVNHYMLADGGLWANNPSLVAVIDAKRRLGIPIEKIKVFSVGTGIGNKFYSQQQTWLGKFFGWGFATRWGHSKFVDLVFNLQSQTVSNILGLMLDSERQVLSLNFESDTELPLDDVGRLADWLSRADKDFTYGSKGISGFLNLGRR